MTKLLVIDHFEADFVAQLQTLSHVDVEYAPDIGPESVRRRLPDVTLLVMKSKLAIREPELKLCQQMKLIVRAGAGLEHIDVAAAKKRGILVKATPGGNASSVGEQAVGMLLSLMHNVARADRQMRLGQWNREANRGFELGDKTVGIIGYGNTGRAFAKRLSGFGCKVLAYDKYRKDYSDDYAREASMEQIFDEADVLSLHVPLTEETRYLVNQQFLDRFRKAIWLLNLARGPVALSEAIIEGLRSHRLLGAGLDVFENEDFTTLTARDEGIMLAFSEADNLIMTPHIGGWSHESARNINQMVLAELREWLRLHGAAH